jgi:hypothetical protein
LGSGFYRALIRCLPASVREDYGAEMVDLFAEHLAAAERDSLGRACRVWCRGMLDALQHIPREHWRVAGRYSQEESMYTFWPDLRFAARSLSRQRGATALVLLTASGIIAAFAPARRAASVNPTTVLAEGH